MESVTGPIPGQPGQVRVAGGQTISASQAVVVATEAPAARSLLGEALTASDSKSEEAVGTANLYFRCSTPLPCARPCRPCIVSLVINAKGTMSCLLQQNVRSQQSALSKDQYLNWDIYQQS